MDETTATQAIHEMCKYLYRYYGKKVIILLDEYDTPMQEAYVNGFWDELVSFTRSMFNAAFKTNPYLEVHHLFLGMVKGWFNEKNLNIMNSSVPSSKMIWNP